MAEKLGHDELSLMSVGAIYGFLTGDTISTTYIADVLDREGVTGVQLLSTLAGMAAAMLNSACGKVEARAVAAEWFRRLTVQEAGRETRIASKTA